MMFRRGIINDISLILILSLIFLTSCSKESKGKNNTLVIGDFFEINPASPLDDPIEGIFSSFIELVYEGLNSIDKNLEISNKLAVLIRTEGTKVFIKLRDNVYFSDGYPLSSDDVLFSINACREIMENKNCRIFENIASMEKVSNNQIVLNLKREISKFERYFTALEIIPMHLFPQGNYKRDILLKKPTGTGPYMIEKMDKDKLILGINKYYYSKKPKIEKIIFIKVGDKRKAWALLLTKEIDMIINPTESEFDLVKEIPYLRTYRYVTPFNYILIFNNKKSIFRDKRVKQALNLAVDKEKLVKEILVGWGNSSNGIFPRTSMYNSGSKPLAYDPIKAKNILEAAGWRDQDHDGILEKNGNMLAFKVYNIAEEKKLFDTLLFLKSELLEIGVKLDVDNISIEDFVKKHLLKKDFDAILYAIPVMGDPDYLYDSLHSSMITRGFNWANYSNPEVDKVLDLGIKEKNEAKRKETYSRLQELLQLDPPGIFLYWGENGVIVNSRFSNINEKSTSVFVDIPNWEVN